MVFTRDLTSEEPSPKPEDKESRSSLPYDATEYARRLVSALQIQAFKVRTAR